MIKEAKKTDPVMSRGLAYVLQQWSEKHRCRIDAPCVYMNCLVKMDISCEVQESLYPESIAPC